MVAVPIDTTSSSTVAEPPSPVPSSGRGPSVAWGVVALVAAGGLVAAAFASWSSDLPSGLAGSFRFWVLYSAAVTALGGVASIFKYRVGVGVSAGALVIFGPLAAANIHDYIDFGFSIGPGLYALLAAGLAGLVLAVVTLTWSALGRPAPRTSSLRPSPGSVERCWPSARTCP